MKAFMAASSMAAPQPSAGHEIDPCLVLPSVIMASAYFIKHSGKRGGMQSALDPSTAVFLTPTTLRGRADST